MAPRVLSLFGSRVIFGAERENIEVLAALRDQGAEVLCVVRPESWNAHVTDALTARGLACTTAAHVDGWLSGWGLRILLRNPIAFVRGNWRVYRTIRSFKPTRIHAFNHFLVFSFWPALMLTRVPLVYRAGDVPVRHRLIWRLVWRFIVRRTKRFLAVSQFIATKLKDAGVPPARIEVIYAVPPARVSRASFSVSRDSFSSGTVPPAAGAQDIVFVGQIIRDKGPHLLVEAFRSLAQRFPSSRLLLAGRVSDWEGDVWARELRDGVTRDADLQSRVIFTGFVEDVPALLQGRLVLVAPSLIEEALGLVVLEAKRAGLPAIVFPSGGLPEMIEQGATGFVCTTRTPDALANDLARYLADPSLAARHGAAARASLAQFGVDSFGGRVTAQFTV